MENFNKLMFEALDDTLRLVLGETVSKLVYLHTGIQTSLKPNEIEVITSYLEKVLGKEGAQIIQTISIKRLCLKLKREYEEVETHFMFLDELYEAKFKLLNSVLNKKQSAHN